MKTTGALCHALVSLIVLLQQEFEARAVLAGDSSDEGGLAHERIGAALPGPCEDLAKVPFFDRIGSCGTTWTGPVARQTPRSRTVASRRKAILRHGSGYGAPL